MMSENLKEIGHPLIFIIAMLLLVIYSFKRGHHHLHQPLKEY
jgi:hypothetical protein